MLASDRGESEALLFLPSGQVSRCIGQAIHREGEAAGLCRHSGNGKYGKQKAAEGFTW